MYKIKAPLSVSHFGKVIMEILSHLFQRYGIVVYINTSNHKHLVITQVFRLKTEG